MSLTTVREKMSALIQNAHPEFNVHASMRGTLDPPLVVITPATDVGTPSADYTINGGRSVRWHLDVIALVPFTDMESSQNLLDTLVSPDEPNSIFRALRGSPTLDGSAEAIRVIKMQGYGGEWSACSQDHIGAVIKVEVDEASC
jgi:hypothetical protein